MHDADPTCSAAYPPSLAPSVSPACAAGIACCIAGVSRLLGVSTSPFKRVALRDACAVERFGFQELVQPALLAARALDQTSTAEST